MINGYICNESAGKLVEGDPHARLFDLNGKTMRGWGMIAAYALSEDEDLQNYIDMAMLFTCTLPPKTVKWSSKKMGLALINSA